MRIRKESALKDRVLKDLSTLEECWAKKFQEVSRRGIPDIIICYQGDFISLELKRSRGGVTAALQTYTLNKIKEAGGFAEIVDENNWDEIFLRIRTKNH